MRWKMKFLMAVTILVVSTTASPGYSEFLAGGEFPILGAVSVGRGEQVEPVFVLRPVIFDTRATSLSAAQLTITLQNTSLPPEGVRCSQSFNLTDGWTRGINSFNVRPLSDRVLIKRIEEELDPCFDGWTRMAIIFSGPRVFRFEEGPDNGAASGAAQIIPLLLSVIGENGETRAQGRVYTVWVDF